MKNFKRSKVIIKFAMIIFLLLLFLFIMYNFGHKPRVYFSYESGFYDKPIKLELKTSYNAKIYYTLDCTDPNENSMEYIDPINLNDASKKANLYSMRKDTSTEFYNDLLDRYQTANQCMGFLTPDYKIKKCNVVRAVAISNGGNKSEIFTKVYFIKNKTDILKNINTITINTDPQNLFDYNNGIYVTGKNFDDYIDKITLDSQHRYWNANYRQKGKKWERKADISIFDKEGKLYTTISNAGIRIQGDMTRFFPQKSLNIYNLKKDYSFGDIFGNQYTPKNVTLSCGGNDIWEKFQDYLVSERCRNLNFSTKTYIPYNLYLEGEYWGLYMLSEKFDKYYLANRFNVLDNNILLIKDGIVEEGPKNIFPDNYFESTIDAIVIKDLSIEKNYIDACSIIDIDSFVDYYASMIYLARNFDWPYKNIEVWRTIEKDNSQYGDCKWRWMAFDSNGHILEPSFLEHNTLQYVIDNDKLFASLFNNKTFRKKFKNRLYYIADSCFNEKEINKFIIEYFDSMHEPLQESWRRFLGRNSVLETQYYVDRDNYLKFFKERRKVIDSWF